MRLIKNKNVVNQIFKNKDGQYFIEFSDEELREINRDIHTASTREGQGGVRENLYVKSKEIADAFKEAVAITTLHGLSDYKKMLWKSETNPEARHQLLDSAISAMAKSVALNDGPFGFFELGELLELAGRNKDARDIYSQFLEEMANWKFKDDEQGKLLRTDLEEKAVIIQSARGWRGLLGKVASMASALRKKVF